MAAATKQTEPNREIVTWIPLGFIHESPTNPRKHFDQAKLDELAETIRVQGVLEPILVRPRGKGDSAHYELVFGARRVRAAKKAGLESIPALVRELGNLEVLELQLVENGQRDDITALEEGETFKLLRDRHGKTPEQIAERVGKSKATVHARLKLTELAPKARKLLADGKLTASVAVLVARIGDPKRQDKAAGELTSWARGDGPVGFRRAKEIVERGFMVELKGAPFALTDAELLPEAGPCSTCKHRSGNQVEAFGEAAGGRADVCTEPPCFQRKREAANARALATAKASGRQVLEGAAAKKAFHSYGGVNEQLYVKLDDVCYDDPKYRHYRALLGKTAPDVAIVTISPKGDVVELVPKAKLAAALKAKGHIFAVRDRRARAGGVKASKAEKRKRFKKAVAQRAIADIGRAARKAQGPEISFWRFVAAGLVRECWHETLKEAVGARQTKAPAGKPKRISVHASVHDMLVNWVEHQESVAPLRELVVELIARRAAVSHWYHEREGYGDGLRAAAALYKVSLPQLERELAGGLQRLAKARGRKATTKKASARRKKA